MVALAAIAIALLAVTGCERRIPSAGFWFEDPHLALPAPAAKTLGGPLTDAELHSIETTARGELERAFDGLRVRLTDSPSAFWRVAVVRSLPARSSPLPSSGESMPLGWMGGAGAVSFDLIALKAIQYAPPGAVRQTIIDGIGHGIGRTAVHEFAHQMLNSGVAHDQTDDHSYEYPSPDRAAQSYGDVHWTTARPLLEEKLR